MMQCKYGQYRKSGTIKWFPRTEYGIRLDEKQSKDVKMAVTSLFVLKREYSPNVLVYERNAYKVSLNIRVTLRCSQDITCESTR